MFERVNLYETLLKILNGHQTECLFYINGGYATVSNVDEEAKTITFYHENMAFDIVITADIEGDLAGNDLIEWEDQGDYYDIRIVEPVYIRKYL